MGAFANPVRIVGLDRQGYNLSRFVLTGSTFHELGHASHWRQKGLNFAVYDDKVRESYARAVEYYFYPDFIPIVGEIALWILRTVYILILGRHY